MASQEAAVSASELQRVEQELKEECENLWQELQSVQNSVAQSAKTVAKNNSLPEIYKEKEKLLRAQIEVLKQHKVTIQEPSLHILTIKDKLTTLNGQLQETLDRIKEEKHKHENDIKQAEKLKNEQQQVKATLEERVKEQVEKADNPDAAAVESQIDQQITKYTAYYKKTLKEFLPFVRKHYPSPANETDDSTNKSRVTSQNGGRDVMSLSSMLEQLMNKCIESDPYVALNPEVHWQPYVELLLRSGIAIRHPTNDNLIKITPFHL